MRRYLVTTALLLAACGQSGGGNQQTQAGAPAAAPARAPPAGGGAITTQPGEWEITMTMTMPDMPNVPAGRQRPDTPRTMRTCVTPEQVSRNNAAFLSGGSNQQGIDCDYRGVTVADGHVQGTSTCSGRGMQISAVQDGTYSPTSYDMTQQISTTMGGRTRQSTLHMVGQRVGDCPAG